MKSKKTFRFFAGILIGLSSALLIWFLTTFLLKDFFFSIEARTYDWRMRKKITPLKNPLEDIVIIDIDAFSVKKLGKFHFWPRTYLTRVISNLSEAGARLIGLDLILDPDFRHMEEDQALQRTMASAGNVCTAFYLSMADSASFMPAMSSVPRGLQNRKLIHPVPPSLYHQLISLERFEPEYPDFLNASACAGYVNMFPDPDGVLRRLPLFLRFNENVYAALSVQMALKLLEVEKIDYNPQKRIVILQRKNGEAIPIPTTKRGQILINFAGPYQSFRYVPFYDVLMKRIPLEYFKDRVVLIGTSLPGLYDLRVTPVQAAFPGVEINANIIHQILNRQFIHLLPTWWELGLLLGIGFLAGLLLIFLRPVGGFIATALLIVLLVVASFFALVEFSLWVPLVAPVLIVVLTFSLDYAYRYLSEEKDKRQIRQLFSHYVSPAVVEVLLEQPEKVGLGGDKKVCTVLFSDLAGFTSIAENMPPEELVQLLNEYHTEMTEIIFEHQGMLDKYEGDAIMAVFGAPVEIENHAELACRTALKMQKRLEELRNIWSDLNKPALSARIGINTGEMVVGNMGSRLRFDYTVIGDPVNLAARLENANKVYDTQIMVGEATFQMVKEQFVFRPLDLLRVKGKQKPVRVFELIATKEEPLPSDFLEMLHQFQQGFDYYLNRNWEWAANHFRQALQIRNNDGPSRLYLLRCQEFLLNPPGKEWDGVFTMKTK